MDNLNQYNQNNETYKQNEATYHTQPSSEGTPALYRPYKRGMSTKGVIAIILCCAILFGGIGFGSAWYLKETSTDSSPTVNNAPTDHTDQVAAGQPQTDLSLKMAKGEE
ncbi:MAG: hypothetical protein IKL38_01345, partial [Firmicutes bacterium]|nr:hypothetical protein [Bacillota bacterium]